MNDTPEYRAYEHFVDSLSKEELINFMMNQQRAIDGLTENNETFRKTYAKEREEE